jgi:hypothetical protein
LAKWHIARSDSLRNSVATRASVTLSANALIVAGTALLSNQFLDRASSASPALVILFALIAIFSLVLVAGSVAFAIGTLVTKKNWRVAVDDRPSLGFSGLSTVKYSANVDEFKDMFCNATDDEVLRAAVVELWAGLSTYLRRYVSLRRAIRWLLWAILSFLSITLLFILDAITTNL